MYVYVPWYFPFRGILGSRRGVRRRPHRDPPLLLPLGPLGPRARRPGPPCFSLVASCPSLSLLLLPGIPGPFRSCLALLVFPWLPGPLRTSPATPSLPGHPGGPGEATGSTGKSRECQVGAQGHTTRREPELLTSDRASRGVRGGPELQGIVQGASRGWPGMASKCPGAGGCEGVPRGGSGWDCTTDGAGGRGVSAGIYNSRFALAPLKRRSFSWRRCQKKFRRLEGHRHSASYK